MRGNRAGFSLVELAIVVSIIGLVIGGIMGGRHLIHATELNSIVQDFEYYASASRAFQERFNAYPGDMKDATRYFGRDPDVTPAATCLQAYAGANPTMTGGTCNGGGDGRIGQSQLANAAQNALQRQIEFFNWPQHMNQAGLIGGSYEGYGAFNAPGGGYRPGIEVIGAKYESGILGPHYYGALATQPDYFAIRSDKHALRFSHTIQTANNASILTPEDARNFDRKYDDAMPASGRFIVQSGGGSPYCTKKANGAVPTVSTDLDAQYNLGYKGLACTLIHMGAF